MTAPGVRSRLRFRITQIARSTSGLPRYRSRSSSDRSSTGIARNSSAESIARCGDIHALTERVGNGRILALRLIRRAETYQLERFRLTQLVVGHEGDVDEPERVLEDRANFPLEGVR